MASQSVALQASLQLLKTAPLRRTREDSLVEIRGREPSDAPDDDPVALLVPFQRGAWADAEFSPDRRWNRYLALSGETRMRDCHAVTLPGY
jgi:hypothetical protein